MDIINNFYSSRNETKALQMSAYMKNNFPFLGLTSPERKKLSKDFLKEHKKAEVIDWNFIDKLYNLPEREFQYLAIDYLTLLKNQLEKNDIGKIKILIETKSWWDSIDSLDAIVGNMCIKYPDLKDSVLSQWMISENIWLIRISIDFQLQYKEKTDTSFLSRAILRNCETHEFFINKAIGWSLREYSKTNKEWVREFISSHNLSKLSIKEGSKYL